MFVGALFFLAADWSSVTESEIDLIEQMLVVFICRVVAADNSKAKKKRITIC